MFLFTKSFLSNNSREKKRKGASNTPKCQQLFISSLKRLWNPNRKITKKAYTYTNKQEAKKGEIISKRNLWRKKKKIKQQREPEFKKIKITSVVLEEWCRVLHRQRRPWFLYIPRFFFFFLLFSLQKNMYIYPSFSIIFNRLKGDGWVWSSFIFFIFHSFLSLLLLLLLLLLWFCFIWILWVFSFVSSLLSSEFVFFHSNGLRRASNHGSPSLCGYNNRPTHQQQLIAAAGQSEPTVLFSVFPTLRRKIKNLLSFHSFSNWSMISVLFLLLPTKEKEVETFSFLFISISIIFY